MEKRDHFRASTEEETLLYSRETTLQYSRETTLLHSMETALVNSREATLPGNSREAILLLLLLPLQKNATINVVTEPPEKDVRFICGLISGTGRDTIRNE